MDHKKVLRNVTLLTTGALATMHFFNKYLYTNAVSQDLLQEEQKEYYDWKNGMIFYTVQGTGKPLLLIHDLDLSSSSYEWSYVVKELSKTHKVYALDLLGCGCSEKNNFIYTNYLYMQMIRDFIKDVIKEKADVVATGHSIAFTIMACAEKDTMIDQLVLISPESVSFESDFPEFLCEITKYFFAIPVIGRFAYNLIFKKETLEQKFYTKYFAEESHMTIDTLNAYYESLQKDHAHGRYLYSSILCGFMNYNIQKSLSSVENSVSILIGSEDIESKSHTEEYKNLLSKVEVEEISHAKYLPQLEVPEKFVETLERVLVSQ